MLAVFKAQLKKDVRKPVTIIAFMVVSILATLIFGNSTFGKPPTVPVFSTEPNGKEIEEKWIHLLRESEALNFVLAEEEGALEDVASGKSNVAIKLMENDYRIITASNHSIVPFVEQEVHTIFSEEAQLQAVVGEEDTTKIRKVVASYLENPPLQVEVKSISGGEIPKHDMGTQLLFVFTLFAAMFTIGFKVNGINEDKVNGIWNRLILSPVTKTNMYVGHLLYSFCIGFFQISVVLLLFQYVLKFELGDLRLIMMVAAIYTLSIVSLAMLISGFLRTPEKFNMVFTSFIPMIPVISGLYMPPGTVSNPILSFVADLFPLKHAADAMLNITLYNANWNDISLSVAILLLIFVIYMGIGINLVERRRG
ncbi:ABC transporter permease [Robertmurraya sp. DFI.2.37]|uniref:ABC transporter permease n=1 Tax=Robertmurraya sp. DFI.2.37 TaxID=3031819 RepID=UPI0012488C6A|nr:ABC transporter permease [Robertmurraya sp. DFI.2.37]MDF1509034.1 ABC transporter permease [Robertmurraya sp. DFI.2.37]